jgi:cytoskeletal protein CcmA (bactofilin family)
MDKPAAASEGTPVLASEGAAESSLGGLNRFTLRPGDSLEGKLTYDGHVHVQGRAEGEFRVTGNFDVAVGATVKALLEASSLTLEGEVEGTLTARDKLTLSRSAKLTGDLHVRRLQIEDGASLNGHVRMGDFE